MAAPRPALPEMEPNQRAARRTSRGTAKRLRRYSYSGPKHSQEAAARQAAGRWGLLDWALAWSAPTAAIRPTVMAIHVAARKPRGFHRWNALGVASKSDMVGFLLQNSTILRTLRSRFAGVTSKMFNWAAWNP